MSDIFKDLEDVVSDVVKDVEKNLNKLGEKIDKESKKLDIKSQIGNHERKIRQNYTKLGKAYYNNLENNESMTQVDIIVDSIKANLKVVELLKKQLDDLD
ncbi:MAG: hypothetical protein GX675_03980 [Erysipelotrichaceae bacterium]|nr:hypothetical protein [Erysipelotrichaceae bacterium]